MTNGEQSFLESIVDSLPAEKNELFKLIFIFPNRRSTRFFADQLAKKFQCSTLILPEIYSLDDFLAKVFQKSESSALEQLVLLNSLLVEPSNSYYSEKITPALLMAMIKQMQQIFNHCSKKEELNSLENSLSKIEENSLEKKLQKNFLQIAQQFKSTLETHNLSTSFFLRQDAIFKFDLIGNYFQNKSVYLCGFNALSASEEKIFQLIKANQEKFNYQLNFFLDYDQSFLQRNWHQAGYFYHRFWSKFLGSSFIFPTLLKMNKKLINAYSCPDQISQARKVAELITEITSQQTEAELLQTAIVIADPQDLPPLLSTLPSGIKKNLTMGLPLKFTPALAFLKELENLLSSALQSQGQLYLQSSVLEKLLLHPYLHAFSCQLPRLPLIKLEELPEKIKPLSRLVTVFLATTESAPAVSCLVSLLQSILKQNHLDTLCRASVEKLAELSIELNFLLERGCRIAQQELLKFLSDLCQYELISFIGEPLSGIQLVGVLETQCLNFKNLFLLSFNEGIFPPTPAPSNLSFLPADLLVESLSPETRAFLFDPRQESNVNAYHFYRLLQCAERIEIFYLQEKEDSRIQVSPPSRFLLQLEADDELFTLKRKVVQPEMTIAKQVKIKIAKNGELLDKLIQFEYSPTSLFTYLECPLKFYWQYCAGIKAPSPEDPLEALSFGTILHNLLKVIYQPLCNKARNEIIAMLNRLSNNESELKEKIDNQIREFLKIPEQIPLQGKVLLLSEILKIVLRKMLKADEERLNKFKEEIKIIELETKKTITYQFQNLKLKFIGYLDRLEKIGDNLNICDYKSGKSAGSLNKNKPNFKKLIQFQLAFYALFFEVENLLLTKIAPEDFQKTFSMINWKEEQRQKFRNFLNEQILQPLFSPGDPFQPVENGKDCTKCYYNFLCRH